MRHPKQSLLEDDLKSKKSHYNGKKEEVKAYRHRNRDREYQEKGQLLD